MSNNWKEHSTRWVPRLKVTRRSTGTESSVSVNARLSRLSSNDLLDLIESSLGTAGRDVLHMRGTGDQLGQYGFYLDRSMVATKQAYEALQVLVNRGESS